MHFNVYVDLFDIIGTVSDNVVDDKHFIKRVDSMKSLQELIATKLKAEFPGSSVQLLAPYFNVERKATDVSGNPCEDVEVHVFFTSHDTDTTSKDGVVELVQRAKKIVKNIIAERNSWLIVMEMPSEERICGVCGSDIDTRSADYLIRTFDYLQSPKEEEEEGYEDEAVTVKKEINLFFHHACIRNLGKRESYKTPNDFYGE